MQFIERVNLTSATWLKTQPKSSIIEILKRKSEDVDTIDVKYNKLMNFLTSSIKANGEINRLYTYSLTTFGQPAGRMYSPLGVQGLQKEFRGVLMPHTTDIDMCNAHPTILQYICKKHGIKCDALNEYVKNRDVILSEFPDKNKAKELFISSMNYDKRFRGKLNPFFKKFDSEMKRIQTSLSNLSEYSDISTIVKESCIENHEGKLLNRILNLYENKILQEAIRYLTTLNIEIAVLMFDGLMVYGDYYLDNDLLEELDIHTNDKFPGLNMRWAYKNHSTDIVVPLDFTIEPIVSKEEQEKKNKKDIVQKTKQDLDDRVIEFEKTHCKIINKGIYICEYPTNRSIKTIRQLSDTYEHLETGYRRYKMEKEDTLMPCSFISYWTESNPTIRQYTDMGIYPNESKCPTDMYNLWTPFIGESLSITNLNTSAIELARSHILTLCGGDVNISTYMESWIAQMIQYPDVKTNCPILISKEGAGKGTLMKMLQKMLGVDKCMESSNPSRDVWGNFNGRMANSFLVNLNELSKKETIDSMGQIKALITDPNIIINEKGVAQYPITSYHRFIITTNNEDPIDSKEDDRRFWIVRCSDTLIGDKEYFDSFNTMLEDTNAVASIYHYFKTYVGFDGYTVKNFHEMPKPTTIYQSNIQQANVDPVLQWLIYLACSKDQDNIDMTTTHIVQHYNDWCKTNGMDYKMNIRTLSKKLSNLAGQYTSETKHTMRGTSRTLFLKKIREFYGINVERTNDDDTDDDFGGI